MLRPRVIPQLLLQDKGLYKGRKFHNHRYIGDPLNSIKLFNEMSVDELIITDFSATNTGKEPDLAYLTEIASEAFMPLAYGGGIRSLNQMEQVFASGFEKIILNTVALENPNLISQAADHFGSQSIVLSIDYKKGWWGGKEQAWTRSGRNRSGYSLLQAVAIATDNGAGEIVICSIAQEGSRQGYDLKTIETVAQHCTVPLVASGGAGTLEHLRQAREAGASAMSAGSLFVFQGLHRAVLINYPDNCTLDALFSYAEQS